MLKADIKAYDYFRHIAAILNDDEPNRPFQRYPLRELVNAYNDGMTIVYSYRPDLFTQIYRCKLNAGIRQDVSDRCDNVLQVLEQVTEQGDLIKPIFTTKSVSPVGGRRNAFSLTRDDMAVHIDYNGQRYDYLIDSVSIDPELNGMFSVYPAVPPDADVWVNIKCYIPPRRLGCEDLDDVLISSALHSTAVQHYIISKMLTGNIHSQLGYREGVRNSQMFFELLGIEMKMEQNIEGVNNNDL